MRAIKVLFIIFLLLFPLGEIGRLDLGNNIAVTITDIFVGIVVDIWFITHFLHKHNFDKKLAKPMLFFVIVCILSLLLNIKNLMPNEFFVAVLYLLRWVVYAGLYFVVAGFDSDFKKKVAYLLGIAGGLIVLGGYIQYFFYPNLRNLYYLGWDEHLFRMFSTFLDPNFAGAFFVLYLFLIAGLYARKKEKKIKLLLAGVAIVTVGAIFLTYSRSAYLMLLVSSTLFLFLVTRSRRARTIIISLEFLALLAAIVFLSKLPQSEGTNLLRTASGMARIENAKNAITIFKDNPLFGVGFDAYRYAQYRNEFIEKNPTKDNHAGAGTDNSFLFILATTGIVGFLAYVYLLFSVMRNAYHKNILFFCSLVVLSIDAFFINSLFYPFLMMWIWIIAGLTENTSL